MRQNLKLEKEAAFRNLNINNNFSKTIKEPKSPARNQKQKIQILNYNPYGTTFSVNRPTLQSNYMYNLAKKEKENYNDSQINPKINVIEESKKK